LNSYEKRNVELFLSLVIFVIFGVVRTMSVTPLILDGLVAYYSFDNNASDLRINGNNETLYGGVTFVDGINHQAAYFDGINDYMESPKWPKTTELSCGYE